MQDLPRGTVTFLFTDIEGSTRLLREHRDSYGGILAEHARVLRAAFERNGGREVDTQGDSFFAAFPTAKDAAAAAVDAQRALAAHAWPDGTRLRVRMGMHTGEPAVRDGRYVGLAVHRAARICSAAHGGQVLLSSTTSDLGADELAPNTTFRDLGEQQLKDFERPERVFQLVIEGLPADFPPLTTSELPAAAEPAQRRVRHRLLAFGIWPWLGALAAVVAVPLALAVTRGDPNPAAAAGPNSLALIDPSTNEVRAAVPLGASPSSVEVGGGAVWAVSERERTIIRVDPEGYNVEGRLGLAISARELESADGALWLVGNLWGGVARFNPQSNEVAPLDAASSSEGYPVVAFTEDRLWFGGNDGLSVSLIDPDADRRLAKVCCEFRPEAIAAGDDTLWIVERYDQTIIRLDGAMQAERARIPFGAPVVASTTGSTIHEPISQAVVAAGSLWVTDSVEGTVWQFDAIRNTVKRTIATGAGAGDVAYGAGAIWVANRTAESLSRIDPSSGAILEEIDLGRPVIGVAVGEGGVWVALQ